MALETVQIAASFDDQWIYRQGAATYAGVPSATLTRAPNTDHIAYTDRDFNGSTYGVMNTLLRFNTGASLPDAADVHSAELRIFILSDWSNVNSLSMMLGYYGWDGSSTSDWAYTPETNAHAGTSLSSFTLDAFNNFSLDNLTNISTTGYTNLRMHISQRASNAAPTGYNYMGIRTYDYAVATSSDTRPRIIIDYTMSGATRVPPDSIVSDTGFDTPVDLANLQLDPDA